ncbi:Protein SRG1 [Camellia lanceoleosa]|uniref:Protein SRG1 n=1 Tax=Camellia lanceoleosa TaxID=1840588 RepID=A0ACC0GFF2_9ERIC|nr:Protein SRG1 [Camellia lanceoleosa]
MSDSPLLQFYINNWQLKVGDGSRVRFWLDKWCHATCFKEEYSGLFSLILDNEVSLRTMYERKETAGDWVFNFRRKFYGWKDCEVTRLKNLLGAAPALVANQVDKAVRDSIEAYSAELKSLAMKLLESMAKALNMKGEEMRELFEEGMQSMRMNYYPPCPQPELVIRLTPHSDPVGLTILLQINEMKGLQIKKDGMSIPIKPLPNAFIVNIGDILETVTNGIYELNSYDKSLN